MGDNMLKNSEGLPTIICIVGPTASGKTKLSVELAKNLAAQIISADSMQIYKELDIGTAKVTVDEMQGIKHHFIDICDLDEKYSVAKFKEDCYKKIDELISDNKNVIVAGGTGLYISAITKNMEFIEMEQTSNLKEELYELAKKYSNHYVHDILKDLDEVAALNIHPNNLKRVIRAIEYAKFGSVNKSEHLVNEAQKTLPQKYDFKVFALNFDRKILYDRINQRVDIMFEQGLLEEAKMLYDKKLSKDYTCMQAIGYKELIEYFEGNKTLEEAKDLLKQNTRRYAKRQMTWFKKLDNVIWLDASLSTDELIDKIMEELNGK